MNRLLLYVVGLIAAGFFAFSFISSNQESIAKKKYWDQKVPIAVAKVDIEPGTILTEEMMKLDTWPRGWVKPGTTEWPKAIVGKVALYKINKGAAFIDLGASGNISEKNERLGLSYIVPNGQRAVSLPVSPQNMHSALIRPGDRVDVIITNGDLIYTGAPMIIQDVQILAIVQDTNRNLRGTKPNVKYDPNFNSGDRKDTTPWTVTLAMDNTDAQKALIASTAKEAEVRLAIRVNGDHSVWDTKAVMKDIYTTSMEDKIIVIKGGYKPETTIVYAPEQD